MIGVISTSNKNLFAAIIISVVLIIGIGTVLDFQQQQDAVYAQAPGEPPFQGPGQFKPEATIYRVTFHSVKVIENHDTFLGNGEWKLYAIVNGNMRLLETCSFLAGEEPNEKLDCNGKMYDVEDGQVVNFESLFSDVKIARGGAIVIFVQGIDTDGEAWEPPTLPNDVQAALWAAGGTAAAVGGPVNPITAIAFLGEVITNGGEIVSWFASLDENDKLGKIQEIYKGPKYETGIINHPSNTGDYVLKYSIKAIPTEDAYYSFAEDCKPPIASIRCNR